MCQYQVSTLSAAIVLFLAAHAASAQSSDPVDLDSVSVTGVRASIQKSLVDKHSAGGIVDTISAEDIGKFPDLNLSESLQRVSGITLDRNNVGEGSSINLRGLGQEFTRVEINGMPGMSSGGEHRTQSGGNGTRGFNFEMFSSELFSKAKVYKTGMAEVDEGGLAGTVKLETPRPLETHGTRVVASVLGNYSESVDTVNPRTALLFSHNKDDVFGIAASLAWSQTDFSSSVVEAASWRPFALYDRTGISAQDPVHAARRAALVPLGPLYFAFAQDRKTTGSTLTLQFRPSDAVNISLDAMYGALNNKRIQLRQDMPLDQGADGISNTVIENGVIVAGDFTGVQQRVGSRNHTNDERYRQLSIKLDWTPDEYWTLSPFLGHSKRDARSLSHLYSFRLADGNGVFDPGTVSYRLRGDFIDFGATGTDFVSNPEDFLFNVFIMSPSRHIDEETQARFDVRRDFSGHDHALKFGLRYNDHKTEHIAGQQWLSRDDLTAATDLPRLNGLHEWIDFKVRGANAPSQLLNVNRNRVLAVFMPNGQPIPGTFIRNMSGTAAQGSYLIQEKITSAFVQMDVVFAAWTLVPGVRYLRTEQIANGSDVVNANLPTQIVTPVRVTKTYNGILPALSARYDVTPETVVRAAYARTLTRPNPVSMAPTESLQGIPNGTGNRGNPTLEPYYAHNLDLGGEWYFSSEGLLALNLFYKKISNFIDTRTFMAERTFPRQEDGQVITHADLY